MTYGLTPRQKEARGVVTNGEQRKTSPHLNLEVSLADPAVVVAEGGPIKVILPWPKGELSPNARIHWAERARAVKRARQDAYYLVRAIHNSAFGWPRVSIEFTFHPPDARARDRDNLIASMKAATDGIADAIGTDDSQFETAYRLGDQIVGGAVVAVLEKLP